jgi:hypothetical protein
VTRAATVGRCTLTTTSSPVRSVARCTWAIDAAARGRRSIEANTSSIGRPRSASMTLRTVANGSGCTRSRRVANSSTSSSGNRPSARRHDLAQLDVRRAEPLGGVAQPAGQVSARGGPPVRRAPKYHGRRAPSEVHHGGAQPVRRRESAGAGELGHLGAHLGADPSRSAQEGGGRQGPRAVVGKAPTSRRCRSASRASVDRVVAARQRGCWRRSIAFGNCQRIGVRTTPPSYPTNERP